MLAEARPLDLALPLVGSGLVPACGSNIGSFWATLKRSYHGTYHHMSEKHLGRYVAEFAGRHNVRPTGTVDQMQSMVRNMAGRRLMYKALVS